MQYKNIYNYFKVFVGSCIYLNKLTNMII